MTLGALLLDYVQPAGTAATARPSINLSAPVNTPSQWRSIHVYPQRTSTKSDRSHFYVDATGKCSQTEYWDSRRTLSPNGEIRVALLTGPGSNDVSAAQWTNCRVVIKELSEQYGIRADQLVIDDTLRLPKSAKPMNRTTRSRS